MEKKRVKLPQQRESSSNPLFLDVATAWARTICAKCSVLRSDIVGMEESLRSLREYLDQGRKNLENKSGVSNELGGSKEEGK